MLANADLEELKDIKRNLIDFDLQWRMFKFRLAIAKAYNPNQPRIPAGNGIVSGRWTDEGASYPTSDATRRPSRRIADVISVCFIDGGNSTSYDEYGNLRYRADYLCPGGQRFSRSGFGRAPGLVRDPFQ